MMDYLWIFLLGGVAIVTLIFFLVTLSRDIFLLKRLRYGKSKLLLNFSFIGLTLASLGLVVFLFNLIKEQIELLY
ncbi:MAG: hypothetical protein LBM95_10035 [Lactobacillales bacterium]|jgi:hypothetical protein|nr:hypothetical protein [Lactobacillales bacterium]